MNTKQIIARRAMAVGGVCLTGAMLAACQSGAVTTTTAAGGPTGGASTGTSLTLSGGQGNGAPTGGASTGSGGSGSNSGGGSGSGSGNGGNQNTPAPAQPPAQGSNSITACTNSEIHTAVGPGNSGVGNFDVVLVFTNVSSQTCTLTGYAGATIEYGNNQSPLNATRRMTAYLGGDSVDSSPQTVTLHPDGTASDLLNWNPGTTNVECLSGPGSAKLLITAPGTTNTLTPLSGIGGLCENFVITPVVPGGNGEKSS